MAKESVYLARDNSGRSEKPYKLYESHIRKTWDLNEKNDDDLTLGEFLNQSEEGDKWINGQTSLEHIDTEDIKFGYHNRDATTGYLLLINDSLSNLHFIDKSSKNEITDVVYNKEKNISVYFPNEKELNFGVYVGSKKAKSFDTIEQVIDYVNNLDFDKKEKLFVADGREGKTSETESSIRKHWNLKDIGDNQMLLSYFLDNAEVGDTWSDEDNSLTRIQEITQKELDSVKSKLVGKNAGLDGNNEAEFYKIIGVRSEPIKFDNEISDSYRIDLDKGIESYYIHQDAIQDFLNGEDTGAFIKGNYKGGTIMLIDKQKSNEVLLNSRFERQESGGSNWSVPVWKVPGKSKNGFDLYITDDNEDGSYYSLIDRDWLDSREESIEELITSHSLETILRYYEDNFVNMNKDNNKTEAQIKSLENFIVKWDDAENNNDFLIEGRLQKEYDQFLMDNDLPELSADDLLLDLKKINSLVGKELVWVDPETKIKKSDKKIIVESVGFNNKGDAFIVYGPSDGDINFLSKVEINKLINGDFGNSHDEASFILLDEYNKINKEEKKTPFNDPYEFIEEFSGYLVGKKIVNEKGEKFTILDLEYLNDLVVLRVESENGEQHPEHLEKYKAFIDGEIVPGHVGYVGESYSLILQEDVKVEEKINEPDYKYYVVNSKTNKIRTGWEYKEDADDAAKEEINYGQKDIAVFAKKTLKSMNVDPELNENWGSEVSDYSIIEEAVRFGVTEGDYDESWVSKYIDGYKNGKYNSVIKARLVYYLDHADKHFKGAITSSQIEKALKFKEIISRVSDELLRIIKKDA